MGSHILDNSSERDGYQIGILGNDGEDVAVEVLVMGSAQSAHPPVVRVSGRAQAELRAGEALVFDWTHLAFCCAVAGEISLRPTTLQEVQRSSAYVPLWSGDGPVVFAHRWRPAVGGKVGERGLGHGCYAAAVTGGRVTSLSGCR
jgi:hypothetical protein